MNNLKTGQFDSFKAGRLDNGRTGQLYDCCGRYAALDPFPVLHFTALHGTPADFALLLTTLHCTLHCTVFTRQCTT